MTHDPAVIWLTGLPGAGKTTIAQAVAQALRESGHLAVVLDGDDLRQGLCADLGFSPADRMENVRRAGEVARLLFGQGAIVVCAFVSPYRASRERVRMMFPPGRFVEVFVKADLETCRARDPKGLYARARDGQLASLTGISAPYEDPEHPELLIDTRTATVAAAAAMVVGHLETLGVSKGRLSPGTIARGTHW
jgi:adenylyl-sulfate kinase